MLIAMILTDRQIKEALRTETIKIDDFDERYLGPATYDLRVGPEAFSSTRREKIDLKEKGVVILEPGDFVIVLTLEILELSNKHVGRIGIRSHFTRRGIIPLTGPQVDPGFEGPLHIGLYNVSPSDVVLPFGEPFCTLELHELNEPVEKPYRGPYHGQRGITAREMEDIIGTRGMTFAEVLKVLGGLGADVKVLTKTIGTMQWVVGIGLTAITVWLAIVGIILLIIIK